MNVRTNIIRCCTPYRFVEVATQNILREKQIALKRQALEKRQAHDREKLRESQTDFRLREERERNKVTEK